MARQCIQAVMYMKLAVLPFSKLDKQTPHLGVCFRYDKFSVAGGILRIWERIVCLKPPGQAI